MFSAQGMLQNGKGAHVQRLSLVVLALHSIEVRKVVETPGCVGMAGSQLLLPNGERTHVQRLSLLILPLISIEFGKIGEAPCFMGMAGFQAHGMRNEMKTSEQ